MTLMFCIKDENFKGLLFEYVTNKTKSILPTVKCSNSSKQIDYAIGVYVTSNM
jgi:hypothetical protein